MTAAQLLASILLLAGMGLMAVLAIVPVLLEREAERTDASAAARSRLSSSASTPARGGALPGGAVRPGVV
ncbi:MAG: hypothetical protein V9G19_19185 [Tetrasphaera sp.]